MKQREVRPGLNHRKGLGPTGVGATGSIDAPCLSVSQIYDQQRALFDHRWSLLLYPRHPIRKLKEGWTFTHPIASKQ